MLPSDTPAEDWSLYFDSTFMSHKLKGVGLIKVRNTDSGEKRLRFFPVGSRGDLSNNGATVKPNDLTIFWPRPGAYNLTAFDTAVFVGRSALRHMKRSASFDHYFITWSAAPLPIGGIVPYLIANARYTSIAQFKKLTVEVKTRAISNRIVLHKTGNANIKVIYMGNAVGGLTSDNEFVPSMDFDSRTRRVIEHLQEIGVTV